MSIFEVTAKQITLLTDEQLVSLLNQLLVLEADSHDIPIGAVTVGLSIKTPDGGD